MQRTTTKVMATMAASGWTAGLAIVTTPLYVRFIGVEAYGLLGLYASLQVVLSLLDLGISATQTRELARMGGDPDSRAAMHRLSRTHEIIYVALAAVAMAALALAAPLVAHHWIKPGALSPDDIVHALRAATLALGAQWLATFYAAGLAGLHRQTLLAGLSVPAVTIRALAPLAALSLVAPTLEVFFTTQAIVSAAHTAILRCFFWRAMPAAGTGAGFDFAALKGTARFSAGMTAVSATAIMLIQADKLLLSKLLPLEQFGYYMLGSALATGITQITGPIFGTMYPRLSQLVAKSDQGALSDTFHATAQFLAAAILPVAAVLTCFPAEVLLAWTGSQAIAGHGAAVLSLLALAWALNGLMSLLFMQELAEGRTAPAIWSHSLLLCLLLPLTYAAVLRYGAVGGAIGWLVLNIAMLAVRPGVSLANLSSQDRRAWWIDDVIWPLTAVFGAGLAIKLLVSLPANRLWLVCVLGSIWLLLAMVAVTCLPVVSRNLLRLLPLRSGHARS